MSAATARWDGASSPGSKGATDMGCICAVMDNHYGRGLTAGYGTPEEPAFWITEGCPLHAPVVEQPVTAGDRKAAAAPRPTNVADSVLPKEEA